MDSPVASAAKVLSNKGTKLHADEIHLRRSKNGFIAKHILRDKDGKPPSDGQKDTAEYNLADHQQIAQHVAQHLPPPDMEGGESEQTPDQPGQQGQ
jgi:hypothetical protein